MQRWLELTAAALNGMAVTVMALWALAPTMSTESIFHVLLGALVILLGIQIVVSLLWRVHQWRERARHLKAERAKEREEAERYGSQLRQAALAEWQHRGHSEDSLAYHHCGAVHPENYLSDVEIRRRLRGRREDSPAYMGHTVVDERIGEED